MSRQQNRFSFVFALCVVLVASAASAVEVGTAADLEAAVARGEQEIELTASEYAISATLVFPKNTYHIVGRSGNARDTVIYGNGTFPIFDFNANKVTGGSIRNLTISNGWAQAAGGSSSTAGFRGYSQATSYPTLSNVVVTCCTIAANGASGGNGAGVSYCKLYDCVVSGNRNLANNKEARGGGVCSCTCYDTDVFGNEVTYHGGGGTAGKFYRCRIYGNTAGQQGGGLAKGSVCYEHTVVSNNTAGTNGGGLYDCNAYESEICFNLADSTTANGTLNGGGVSTCSMISNCTIRGNAIGGVSTSKFRLGAAAHDSTLRKCVVYDNFTSGSVGGAIAVEKTKCLAYDCVFSNNCNATSGFTIRGVEAENCRFYGASCGYSCRFVGCQFWNLSPAADAYYLAPGANRLGSGYYPGSSGVLNAFHSGTVEAIYATNCLFACNTSSSYAFTKSSADTMELVNCTFVDNRIRSMLRDRQDTEATTASPITLINCAFPRNYTDAVAPTRSDVSIPEGENRNIVFRNCLFGPNKWSDKKVTLVTPEAGSVNNVADMKFDTENAEHPYSIKRRSPAIGQGLYQDWMASATDLTGDPRAHEDGTVAIGCYECWIPARGMLLLFR